MTYPLLNEITVRAGEVPCDGVPGLVLKAVAAWQQGPLFLTQLERKLVGRFKQDVGASMAAYGEAVRKDVSAGLGNSLGEGFERFLAELDAGNFFSQLFNPFSPTTEAQTLHPDGFSLFGQDTAETGQIGTDGGSGVEVTAGGCPGVLATSFNGGFTASTRVLRNRLSAAGKVIGLATVIANSPSLLVDTLSAVVRDVHELGERLLTALATVSASIAGIQTALRDILPEHYARKHDLLEFSALLDDLVDSSGEAAATRITSGRMLELSREVRKDIERASAWICSAGGMSGFYTTQARVLEQVLLVEQQLTLVGALIPQLTLRLTRLSESLTGLKTSPMTSAPTVCYSNVFSTINCHARRIRGEVRVFNQQKTQDFMMRRLQWCVTLRGLRLLTEKFSVDRFTATLTETVSGEVGQALTEVTETFDAAKVTLVEELTEKVNETLARYIRVVRAKLRSNVSVTAEESAAAKAVSELAASITGLTTMLTRVIKVPAVAGAIERGSAFIGAMATTPVLRPLVTTLRTGDLARLGDTDALNDSLSGLLAKLLARARECCDASGATDPQSRAGADQLTDMQRAARQDDRREAFDTMFFVDVGNNAGVASGFELRRIKSEVRQLTRLMGLPCLGGVKIPTPPML